MTMTILGALGLLYLIWSAATAPTSRLRWVRFGLITVIVVLALAVRMLAAYSPTFREWLGSLYY